LSWAADSSPQSGSRLSDGQFEPGPTACRLASPRPTNLLPDRAVDVEKVTLTKGLLAENTTLWSFLLSLQLRRGWQNRCCRSAEEPHESLTVLGHRCAEKCTD
jgi:hypothetical protein